MTWLVKLIFQGGIVALLVAGVFALVNAVFEVRDFRKLKANLRERISSSGLFVGLVSVFLALCLMGFYYVSEVMPATTKSCPEIAGKWMYDVYDSDTPDISHRGIAIITVKDQILEIKGIRKWSRDNSGEYIPKAMDWKSSWSEYCKDETIRCTYDFTLDNHPQYAFFALNYETESPSTLEGRYYLLPPINDKIVNCKYGRVVFKGTTLDDVNKPDKPNSRDLSGNQSD